MEDYRKRNSELDSAENKRPRSNNDDKKLMTRVLISKAEFGKVIGKGGHSVTTIQAKSGASVKGSNVDDELRLLSISGSFRQIVDAFELISEILHHSFIATANAQGTQQEGFSLKFLVDDDKVGRIIGMKGVVIQNLKAKSGAIDIKVQKQSQDLLGEKLRVLTIEGNINAMRSAHYLVLEIVGDTREMGGGGGGGGGNPHQSSWATPAVSSLVPVSLQALPSFGVHVDAVRQIGDLRTYLAAFGLELHVLEAGKLHLFNSALATQITHAPPQSYMHQQYSHPSSSHMQQQPAYNSFAPTHDNQRVYKTPPEIPDTKYKLDFYIASDKVGGVIGKGASILKNLKKEFNVFVRIDREEEKGVRKVLIRGDVEQSLTQARERIIELSLQPNSNSGGATDEIQS